MKTRIEWKPKAQWSSTVERETGWRHSVIQDTKPPFGDDAGPSPKELVLMGLAGCTGMDVIGHLKKKGQTWDAIEIEADAEQTTHYPTVFQTIQLTYRITGVVDEKALIDAVTLSQTKYCGVSAMLAKSAEISYQIVWNGSKLWEGKAQF